MGSIESTDVPSIRNIIIMFMNGFKNNHYIPNKKYICITKLMFITEVKLYSLLWHVPYTSPYESR